MFKLIICDEKEEAREFDLSPGTYGLGRSKKNEIVMDERKVSRLHATIQLDSTGDISIEDLGSKEGTFVNGERVQGKVDLKDGDEIKISTFSLEVKEWSGGGETIAMASPDSEEETSAPEPEADLGPQGTVEIDLDAPDNFHLVRYHKLLIISKKRYGEEYLLDKPVVTIGSSPSNCEIFIDEKKVSEKHAQVEVLDGECVLKNLDTKKGTLVNGKYVKEDIPLKKGNCFEVGSVMFRFIDMDEVVQKEELISQSKTKDRKKLLIMALAAITASLVMAVLFKPQKGPSKPKTATQQQKPKAESSPAFSKPANVEKALSAKMQADSSFNTGNELFNKRLWPEAIQQFEEVLKINPEYPGAFNKIEKARDEKNHLQTMEKAEAFITKKEYEQALNELERIPENSVYYQEGQLQIQSIKEKIKELKAAKKIVHKKIPAPKISSKTKTVSQEEKGNQLIDSALVDYLKGYTDSAFDKLNVVIKMDAAKSGPAKSRASSLLKELKIIRDSFQKGHKEYNNNQIEQAFVSWSNGLNIEKKIFGGKISQYSEPIRNIIADSVEHEAKQAYESEDYAAANQHCEKALAIAPRHKDSLKIVNLLYRKAKKLYEEGYIIKDLAPKQAILKMNEVLRITSPNNEYHKKAKAMLAKVEH